MNNSSCYRTFSEYKKDIGNININNLIIPNIYERVIILETINTGPNPKENNILEISCMEMMGGKITGYEFDAYLHPRYSINEVTKQKTNLNNNFYEEYYKDVYASDKNVLEQFKKFVKQSKIISYNGSKEMDFINNEFSYHKMSIFPKNKFYSVLNIFKQMFPNINQNILSLNKCCNFLEIILPKEKFHTSKYDCFSVAKMMSKLYNIINEIQTLTKEGAKENNENENNSSKKVENPQSYSPGKLSFNESPKDSDNEFENLNEIIEEQNRYDENINENIINNNENKIDKFGSNSFNEIKQKDNNNKLLNHKRKKENKIEEIIKNSKNKVDSNEEENEIENILNENENNLNEKEKDEKRGKDRKKNYINNK
jgi:DNA polymerase III epsilon subunit-like protein